jgi:hypothetical protein
LRRFRSEVRCILNGFSGLNGRFGCGFCRFLFIGSATCGGSAGGCGPADSKVEIRAYALKNRFCFSAETGYFTFWFEIAAYGGYDLLEGERVDAATGH